MTPCRKESYEEERGEGSHGPRGRPHHRWQHPRVQGVLDRHADNRLRRGGHGGVDPLRHRPADQRHPGGGHAWGHAPLRAAARAHGPRVARLWHRRRRHLQPGELRPRHEPAPRRLCGGAALQLCQHRPVLVELARDAPHHGHHQRPARLHDGHTHRHSLPVPSARGHCHGLHNGRPAGARLCDHCSDSGLWPLQGRAHGAPDLPLGLPQVRRPQRVHRGERHRHARRQERTSRSTPSLP